MFLRHQQERHVLPDQIASAVRHHWWLFLLRGVAAIVFGVLVLMWPGATVIALTAFIAAYALVDGIVVAGSAVRMRAIFDRWWILLIQGLVSIAFGVLAFINPALSLWYVVISVSLWMLLAGVALFTLGSAQKAMGGSAVGPRAAGVACLVLAVLAVAYPGLTVAGVIALIAWFALVIGIVTLTVAFRVRSLVKAVA
jgi:uncharacterized membrane protein HdeD (DUF308 family)